MDSFDFFCQRLAELRTNKGISARDMSLSLGQSESYINKIENKKSLPSMSVFFYICEFLEIHPKDFFDETKRNPYMSKQFNKKFDALPSEQQEHLLFLLGDLLDIQKNKT